MSLEKKSFFIKDFSSGYLYTTDIFTQKLPVKKLKNYVEMKWFFINKNPKNVNAI